MGEAHYHMNLDAYIQISEERIAPIIEQSLQKAASDPDGVSALRLLEYFRKEVQFEMTLIGIRITWLLAVQAFLVTATVLSFANAMNTNEKFGGWLAILACCICLVGGTICYKTVDAVHGAKCTLDLWHRRTKRLFEIGEGLKERPEWLALILGRWVERDDPFHREREPDIILPRVFIAFWTVLFMGEFCWPFGYLKLPPELLMPL